MISHRQFYWRVNNLADGVAEGRIRCSAAVLIFAAIMDDMKDVETRLKRKADRQRWMKMAK